MKKYNLKTWMKGRLRKMSYQWPERTQAKSDARVERGLYKCAGCGHLFGYKDIKVDHIEPVVPIENYDEIVERLKEDKELLNLLNIKKDDFNEMFEILVIFSRMFCKADQMQVLCDEDHDAKSWLEREFRKEAKKRKK